MFGQEMSVVAEVAVDVGGLCYISKSDHDRVFRVWLDRARTGNNPAILDSPRFVSLEEAIEFARNLPNEGAYLGNVAKEFLLRYR